jgi:hypothetical protein
VGTAIGAVYFPFASIDPQPGFAVVGLLTVHVSESGFGVWSLVFFDEVFTCMSRNFTPTGGEFRNDTLKLAVAGVDRPTGTVAVVGDMDERIPLSRPIVAVAVFLWSASAVAVNVKVSAYG